MTVRNWRARIQEKIDFITTDGEIFPLANLSNRQILEMTGWGSPPNEYATTRGPFQHGESPLSVRLAPRRIQLNLYSRGCSYADSWSARSRLVDALRVNRSDVNDPQPGFLRWYRHDRSQRQLDVFTMKGPVFKDGAARGTPFDYDETIEFVAFNPIIYDPVSNLDTLSGLDCSLIQELAFPSYFGSGRRIFGGSVCQGSASVTIAYAGTWEEYPTIQVIGPGGELVVENISTGDKLELDNYTIADGEVVTFDLRYGSKLVYNNLGDSLLSYISQDTDLTSFSLQPHPLVANGNNQIVATINNGTTDTRVLITYYTRYEGI